MVELRNSTTWDYIRYVFSCLLLAFSTFITCYAIFHGQTTFWPAVPGAAAFVIFIVCMIILGIVEGLQISLVELKRQHPDSYKNSHKRAYKLGQLASHKDNVERFLMGRQVFVVFFVFFIAKLTTITLNDLQNDFVFPVPQWVYASLFETGFLTCILVVIVAQLMPQIVAAKYPVHFLNIPIMYVAYYTCTFVEATGITHATWLLSYLLGKVTGVKNEDKLFQKPDEKRIDVKVTERSKGHDSLQHVTILLDESKAMSDTMDTPLLDKLRNLVKTIDSDMDENKQTILRHYLDSHPEHFHTFPSVIGSKVYPPPKQLAEYFESMGAKVPGFLKDISDPGHVPPHIVACELLAYIADLQNRIKRQGEAKSIVDEEIKL